MRSGLPFQPGIGPHSEPSTIELVMAELAALDTDTYYRYTTGVSYPGNSRLKCDLCLGQPPNWQWAVEVKMLRFKGDNGKPSDEQLSQVVTPVPGEVCDTGRQEVTMGHGRRTDNPACRHCGSVETVSNGSDRGRRKWRCRRCRRSFTATTGTALWGLKTPVDEVARALLVVLRRGSLRAAEEVTGHKYETIAKWLRRAGEHAEALTPVLAHDLQLTAVEIDEFWSFVGQKGAPGASQRRGVPIGAG